jgi:cytochrome c-type biogenesis protein CcmH
MRGRVSWWGRTPPYLLALVLFATPVGAVQPDEMLADPALEARARDISRDIRCPVCQGETIDDSNAPIARDLRLIIRERLVAGDSDQAVVDYIVARYGEGVLFNPPPQGVNLVLWLAGPALLLAGIGVAVAAGRRRVVPDVTLSAEEEDRVREILKE